MENMDSYSRYEVISINYMELLLLVLSSEVEEHSVITMQLYVRICIYVYLFMLLIFRS